MGDFKSWSTRLSSLEAALRPIATRPAPIADMTITEWLAIRATQPMPLDEAGVREEAESLLLEILMTYASTNDAERTVIRKLILDYPSFTWAASPRKLPIPRENARVRLLHFSLLDQEPDPRDAVLWLDRICKPGDVTSEELKALRVDVARMSSDENRYGFGSTKKMLLRGYGQYGRETAPE